ncbi:MAG: Hint domain-containing protein [Defluviimonas denitrificans]
MPQTYIDQFFYMDPGNAPASGTSLTVQKVNFTDSDDDGFIGTATGDTFNGAQVLNVWVGDTITVIMGGVTVTITGVTLYVDDGAGGNYAVFTPTDGTVLQDATFQSSTWVNSSTQTPVSNFGPPCFTPGTLIRVPGGEVAVETLGPGDLVETLDHGPQPLRWVGRRTVEGRGDLAPVAIAAGTLDNRRDLRVSPQHRMLFTGWRAELCTGQAEVLVAAKHLVGQPGITRAPVDEVDYIHLLFDRHEIIFAEGAATESFYPGSEILAADRAMFNEVTRVFPEILRIRAEGAPVARRIGQRHEDRLIAS